MDDDNFDDRSECFKDIQRLKNNYNKCKNNKRAIKQVKNILSNYNCSYDLNDFMTLIYMINYNEKNYSLWRQGLDWKTIL